MEYEGKLAFTGELTPIQLGNINQILEGELAYCQSQSAEEESFIVGLKLTSDFSGITCRNYNSHDDEDLGEIVENVNDFVRIIAKTIPDFGLSGQILIQGDEPQNRWFITVVNGLAELVGIKVEGKNVICPHCSGQFFVAVEEK